ncbi:MAG: hypothetical protein ACI9O6_002647 [Glaciecola sp.]|jgi:hypothetical protein
MKFIISSIIGLVAATSSVSALANTKSEFSFDGEVNAGLIHNSALSVDEIDDVSNSSDNGNEIGAKLNARWSPKNKFKMVAGYSYQLQNYNTFSQYDLALHQVNLDTSYQLNTGELGFRMDAARASLAQTTFLDFQQASVYYGLFVQPQTYVRTSLKLKNREFAELQDRNADGKGVSADVFHFANNANTMLMLGLNIEEEKANNQEFTFKSFGLNSKITHKFSLFGLGSQVGLNWRYLKKDYLNVQEAAERDENRQVLTATWSLNIWDNFAIKTELERGDYSSELETLSYEQNLASLGITYQW